MYCCLLSVCPLVIQMGVGFHGNLLSFPMDFLLLNLDFDLYPFLDKIFDDIFWPLIKVHIGLQT